jgi:hypothetical protein
MLQEIWHTACAAVAIAWYGLSQLPVKAGNQQGSCVTALRRLCNGRRERDEGSGRSFASLMIQHSQRR